MRLNPTDKNINLIRQKIELFNNIICDMVENDRCEKFNKDI